MNSTEALGKLLSMQFTSVLDVGCGDGRHAALMRADGRVVTTMALTGNADIVGDFVGTPLNTVYDAVWASHVLEHQPNVGLFLRKCFRVLRDDGILAITVPPHKPEIVGGHVSIWNTGLLLYNLILAGFDCSQAQCKKYGYNISVIVRKKAAVLPELKMDAGDIELLAPFFPFPAVHGFNGNIEEVNWS